MTHCGAVENDDDDYFEDDGYYDNDADDNAIDEDTASLSEKEILESLYMATDGSNWNENENWLEEDDYCTQYGIRCNQEKSATDIDLTSNNLYGEIPPGLYLLKSLTKLSLGRNEITISFDGIKNA